MGVNKTMTVAELQDALNLFNPNSTWHGWDDGSIVIETVDDVEGYIDPGYYIMKDKEVKVYGKH